MGRENLPAEYRKGARLVENRNRIKMDDRFVYSASGKAYPRTPPRDRNHVRERRLPYIKRVITKGRPYFYFTGPDRQMLNRLPDMGAVDFDHAHLTELAKLEGHEIAALCSKRTKAVTDNTTSDSTVTVCDMIPVVDEN